MTTPVSSPRAFSSCGKRRVFKKRPKDALRSNAMLYQSEAYLRPGEENSPSPRTVPLSSTKTAKRATDIPAISVTDLRAILSSYKRKYEESGGFFQKRKYLSASIYAVRAAYQNPPFVADLKQQTQEIGKLKQDSIQSKALFDEFKCMPSLSETIRLMPPTSGTF